MKRYVSVFEMLVRSSIYKVLGVLGVMVVAETALLAFAWNQSIALLQPTLEEWVNRSWISIPFLLAYWLISIILAFSGTNIGSMQGYTLQRLRISEKKVYLLQCVYNIFCYAILWTTQLLFLLVISDFYMKHKTGALLTNQTVFLAFYRNRFMHGVLPMEDILGWMILGFYVVMTGILMAKFARSQRKGKIEWLSIVFLPTVVIAFHKGLDGGGYLALMVAVTCCMFMLLQAFMNKGVQEDESEG